MAATAPSARLSRRRGRPTLARVSFALGVLSLLSFFPILGLFLIPVPIAGVVTGVLGMSSSDRRFAKVGVGFSAAGLAIDLVWVLAFVFQIGR